MKTQSIKPGFNSKSPSWMHIDLNSCFATIEQQANPLLRGKPIAVAAYTTPRGCILAPSIEAKRYGVKTGMQVQEGKALCSNLIILSSDPPKYRFVNRALLKLLQQYTPNVSVRSIDEMLLHFPPSLPMCRYNSTSGVKYVRTSGINSLTTIGYEIKKRIKSEIGQWLTVSIGIATNPYLAKLGAGLHKPDGLDEINRENILNILSQMILTDFPYIKERNAARLNRIGIKTPVDFYFASPQQLKSAFQSIIGHYWHLRLHGFSVDEVEWKRRSIGHSYALPKTTINTQEIEQLLCKLVEKTGRRLRNNHLTAQGIHLGLNFSDGSFWHKGHKTNQKMYASSDLFEATKQLLKLAQPLKPIRILAVSCFSLSEDLYSQMTLFHDEDRKRALLRALDIVNDKWGEFSVVPGTMLSIHKQGKILDRIAFGRVLDMPDVVVQQQPELARELYMD